MIDKLTKTVKFTVLGLCLGLVGLCATMSCDKPRDGNSQNTSYITPFLISKGDYLSTYEYTPQQNFVFANSTEWNNFIGNVYEYALEYFFVETDINFSVHQVIAVIDKRRRFGWSIDITTVMEYVDKIVVTYTNLDTIHTSAAIACQPYHIVKIPASNKTVVFNYDEKMKGGKGL